MEHGDQFKEGKAIRGLRLLASQDLLESGRSWMGTDTGNKRERFAIQATALIYQADTAGGMLSYFRPRVNKSWLHCLVDWRQRQ